jgi:energy-coupling factor transporter ATP-binding protein EcfA2
MFWVEAVSLPRGELKFGQIRNGQNKTSVIAGPNGSGKTELLATLGRWFSSPSVGGLGPGVSIRWRNNGIAYSSAVSGSGYSLSRVIAQTFSPFSRFAPPRDTALSVTKIYAEAAEQESNYRCVGTHRRTRYISGALSKQVLERGIYDLTEAPIHTQALGKVIRALGFRERIDFRYRCLRTVKGFTIAQELGHFILRKELISSHVQVDKQFRVLMRDGKAATGADPVEMQANQFAAALLMPERLIREAIDQYTFDIDDDASLTELAKQFKVSRQTMEYRVRNLG